MPPLLELLLPESFYILVGFLECRRFVHTWLSQPGPRLVLPHKLVLLWVFAYSEELAGRIGMSNVVLFPVVASCAWCVMRQGWHCMLLQVLDWLASGMSACCWVCSRRSCLAALSSSWLAALSCWACASLYKASSASFFFCFLS